MAEKTITPVQPVEVAPEVGQLDATKAVEAKNKELESRLSEAANKIRELSTINATIEARDRETKISQQRVDQHKRNEEEIARLRTAAEKMASGDTQAPEELARLLHESREAGKREMIPVIESAVSNLTFVNELKAKNPDLIPLEKTIMARTQMLMSEGIAFQQAVNQSVEEIRGAVPKQEAKTPQPVVATPPAGVRGETGFNQAPIVQKQEKVLTEQEQYQEFINERNFRRQQSAQKTK